MLKSTLVRAADPASLADVPRRSPIVLDFGEDAFDMGVVNAVGALGHVIVRVVSRCASLGEPRLESFLRQNIDALVVLADAPAPFDILPRAQALARPHVTVQVPLATDAGLTALKLLSSLGVRTSVDVRGFRDGGEIFLDAMRDAILKPGPRARVSPFEEILVGFEDDATELAAFDLAANARTVDLRHGPVDASWDVEAQMARRVPLLLERHPCAYCEGLGFCGGMLYEAGKEAACKLAFSELVMLHDLARARSQARPSRPPTRGPATNGERRC